MKSNLRLVENQTSHNKSFWLRLLRTMTADRIPRGATTVLRMQRKAYSGWKTLTLPPSSSSTWALQRIWHQHKAATAALFNSKRHQPHDTKGLKWDPQKDKTKSLATNAWLISIWESNRKLCHQRIRKSDQAKDMWLSKWRQQPFELNVGMYNKWQYYSWNFDYNGHIKEHLTY